MALDFKQQDYQDQMPFWSNDLPSFLFLTYEVLKEVKWLKTAKTVSKNFGNLHFSYKVLKPVKSNFCRTLEWVFL